VDRALEEAAIAIPGDFKYPQQPHRSQNADAKRAVGVEEGPDHLEQASRYHLQLIHMHTRCTTVGV